MNPETHTCDCGYTWRHGQSGAHSCGQYYRQTIAELRAAAAPQVVADERAAFEEKHAGQFDMRRDSGNPERYFTHSTNWVWDSWQARAALQAAPVQAQGDAKELTDDEIVQAVRSVGVDTHPSKFGFSVEQIEGMSVTVLRQVIAAIAAKAAS